MHDVNFVPMQVLLLQNVVKMIHADCMLYKLSGIFSTLVIKQIQYTGCNITAWYCSTRLPSISK